MEAKVITIQDFYLNKDRKYTIPRYQRDYSWEKKNIITLLEDLNEEKHYLGNILINKEEEDYEIIDGQQRLLTIFLILIWYKNNVKELKNDLKSKLIVDRLSIEKRIDNAGSQIIGVIFEHNIKEKFSQHHLTFNEVQGYLTIHSYLDNKNLEEQKKIYDNLMSAEIVETSFENEESKSHERFVSLNTKGKQLNEIEIVKSQFFSFLLPTKNADIYKDKWHEMMKLITGNYSDYLQSSILLYTKRKSRIAKEKALELALEMISSEDKAKEFFSFLAEGDFPRVYFSVKSHQLDTLKEYLDKDNISIERLSSIWSFFECLKFSQFDILMISFFYRLIDLKAKKDFSKQYEHILKCIKIILFQELLLLADKKSPSTYGNFFKKRATEMFEKNSFKEIVGVLDKTIIEDLKIDSIDDNYISNCINNLDCTKERDYKYAKYIIQILYEDYVKDLKCEHFLPRSKYTTESWKEIKKIGNIIPVERDDFKNSNSKDKLKKYKSNIASSTHIKYFMEDIDNYIKENNLDLDKLTDSDYRNIVNKRTDNIIEKCIKYFNLLREELKKDEKEKVNE